MPRILYIGQSPASGTGSPVIVLRHLRRFAAAGWGVEVVADYGGDYRDCTNEGWKIYPLIHRRRWWPPYRRRSRILSWLRLRLLAQTLARATRPPDFVLTYLAAHSEFAAQLAAHTARVMDRPLHVLVHDDPVCFPGTGTHRAQIRGTHERVLRAADACWFVSPELADCYPRLTATRRLLLPVPEGWSEPAAWRDANRTDPRIYYAGYVWPQQAALLARIARGLAATGGRLVILSADSTHVRKLRANEPIDWVAPFPTNREALAHLASAASAVLVSYSETVAEMPWIGSSFPSKLIEYCHLGLPLAVVAPDDSAVFHWARRTGFPHAFTPSQREPLIDWFSSLRSPERWTETSVVSLNLARSLFDPARIHGEFAAALLEAR